MFHSVLRLEEMLTLSLPLAYFFPALKFLLEISHSGASMGAGYLLFTRAEAGTHSGAGVAAHRG